METAPGVGKTLQEARALLRAAGTKVTFHFTNAAHDLHQLADWHMHDFGNATADLMA